MTNRKVLLVEDEKAILDDFAKRIRGEGYDVLTAENGAEALKIFEGTTILVVVTDLMMPVKGGFEVLKDVKKQRPATKVIITTSFGKDHAKQALNSQAYYYVEKGFSTTARELLFAIEKAFAEADVQLRVEKEMLSFLTHTLYSATSGGPKTVERVLKYAHSALGARYREEDVYRTINNIARLKSIFLSITNLLDAYQIFVNEPEAFSERWHEEPAGSLSLDDLFSIVLRQSLASLLFEEFNIDPLKRILSEQQGSSLESLRETFLNDVFLPEEMELKQILIWFERYFPIITIEIEGQQPSFDPGGVRRPFLFAILAEIVYNALKYTDACEPIKLQWQTQADTYIFSCSNTFSDISTKRRGSQKGLVFLNNLTQMIEGINIRHKSHSHLFTVELCIDVRTLSVGDAR